MVTKQLVRDETGLCHSLHQQYQTHFSQIIKTTNAFESSAQTRTTIFTKKISMPQTQNNDLNNFATIGGPPGSTPANPTGPSEAGIPESLQGLTEEQLMLGKIAPFWIPDTEAASCMICDAKFTLVRRRHHCRACGQVLCSLCCSEKFALSHMDGKEGRVCKPCLAILARLAKAEEESVNIGGGERTSAARPNPANPMEYCSTVPPHQQVAAAGGASATPPSVMVPVGVLKRPDASSSGGGGSGDPKSVS